MVLHGVLWCSWCVMVIHGASWCFMGFMAYHGASWLFMAFHGASWLVMARHGGSWLVMMGHGHGAAQANRARTRPRRCGKPTSREIYARHPLATQLARWPHRHGRRGSAGHSTTPTTTEHRNTTRARVLRNTTRASRAERKHDNARQDSLDYHGDMTHAAMAHANMTHGRQPVRFLAGRRKLVARGRLARGRLSGRPRARPRRRRRRRRTRSRARRASPRRRTYIRL